MIADWDWTKNWQGYGYPNWWLMEAGRRGFRIEEVPVKSIYGSEKSGIKLHDFSECQLDAIGWAFGDEGLIGTSEVKVRISH